MPLNIDWQQILLHLFNFAILTGGLYFLLYKPVKQFMARRESYYAGRQAESDEKVAEAEALRAQYEEKLRQADEEIMHMRAKAGDEMEAEKQRQLADARKQARSIIDTASKTAEMRSKKALADANGEIRTLAIEAVEKLVVNSGDPLDHFLDAAESEMPDEQ